jgi:hypothetical protein
MQVRLRCAGYWMLKGRLRSFAASSNPSCSSRSVMRIARLQISTCSMWVGSCRSPWVRQVRDCAFGC